MEREISRALSRRPIDATVIPLPTEETTPPVTKMNFGLIGASLLPDIQHHYLGLLWNGCLSDVQLGLGRNLSKPHFVAEFRDRGQSLLVGGWKVHGDDDVGRDLADHFRGARRFQRGAPRGYEYDVYRTDLINLFRCEYMAEIAKMAEAHVLH